MDDFMLQGICGMFELQPVNQPAVGEGAAPRPQGTQSRKTEKQKTEKQKNKEEKQRIVEEKTEKQQKQRTTKAN